MSGNHQTEQNTAKSKAISRFPTPSGSAEAGSEDPHMNTAGTDSVDGITRGPTAKRGRKTVEDRLQQLIAQQSELAGQLKALAAQQRAEARKRQAQLETMIGAACRADESIREFVMEALDRHFKDAKPRAFLKAEGWLS